VDVLLEAYRIYDRQEYLDAAKKVGDFILLAQMPEPQPGWAQQYDADMHPAWARKFEPASVTGGESQGVMRTLMTLYRATGDKRYLEPIPRALAYYKRSLRADGRLARFYELKTNKPLYLTKDYKLTYRDADMPTHYSFIVGSSLDSIEREYNRLIHADPVKLKQSEEQPAPKMSLKLKNRARSIIDGLDPRGAWVEEGAMRNYGSGDDTTRVIDTRSFVENVRTLAQFIKAAE
jgi:hypothetical protein